MLFIGLGGQADATTLPGDVYWPVMLVFAALPQTSGGTCAPQMEAIESSTAITEDWTTPRSSHEADVAAALAQSRINIVSGLHVVDAAKGILSREGFGPLEIRARTVVDPEEDFRIAEIAFLLNADFDTVLRADRKLTRELVRATKIPFNMSLTVREASEYQA
jgi:hypothetical protein